MSAAAPPEIAHSPDSPLAVGTVHCAGDLELVARCPASELADVLEFRLDALRATGMDPGTAISAAAKGSTPLLLTARHPAEGGAGDLASDDERAALLAPWLEQATYLDVELRSRELRQTMSGRGPALILSFHDFETTPPLGTLRALRDEAAGAGAAIFKSATRLRDADDLFRLVEFIREDSPVPLAVMGMGPLGFSSRILLAECGSVLNYGYLSKPNAPGQWPAPELKAALARLREAAS